MDYLLLAILAGFVFVYGSMQRGLERTPFGGAALFAAFGFVLGPQCLSVLDIALSGAGLRILAELTLAVVLFLDAANADLGVIKRSCAIPGRLLGIGLPLTLALGFGVAALLFDELAWVELALLATMLAPTDAALGKAVIANEAVPAPIREGLNVESGLNDGICVPVLLVLLELAKGASSDAGTFDVALRAFADEIGIGAGVGIFVSVVGAKFLRFFHHRGWTGVVGNHLLFPALALTCFGAAQALGGSGFIASFVGGVSLCVIGRGNGRARVELLEVGESVGDSLSLVTWVAFGACVVGQTVALVTWPTVVYALLSLTVIRMVPVFLALAGTGLSVQSKLFLGWFGPRGLASIVFIVMVVDEGLPGSDTLELTVSCAVILSVIGHGLSAAPLARAFGRSRDHESRGGVAADE